MTHENTKGFFFGLLGIFFYSFMLALIKLGSDISAEPIGFARIIGLFLCSLPFAIKKPALFKTKKLHLHLLRALCFLIGNFATWHLLSKNSLTNLSLVSVVAPLLMPLIAWVSYRQTISLKRWVTILIGFCGILLMIQPSCPCFSCDYLTALLIPLTIAISLSSVRKLSETDHTTTILLYYSSFILLFSSLELQHFTLFFSGYSFLLLLGISFCSYLFHWFTTKAYSVADPIVIAPLPYFTLIFCSCFGWLLWGETVDMRFVLGAIFVIVSGFYVILEPKVLFYKLKKIAKNLHFL